MPTSYTISRSVYPVTGMVRVSPTLPIRKGAFVAASLVIAMQPERILSWFYLPQDFEAEPHTITPMNGIDNLRSPSDNVQSHPMTIYFVSRFARVLPPLK